MNDKKKKSFTSIRVDPDLWKEVKIEAIRRDMEVSELVDKALRKELKIEGESIESRRRNA